MLDQEDEQHHDKLNLQMPLPSRRILLNNDGIANQKKCIVGAFTKDTILVSCHSKKKKGGEGNTAIKVLYLTAIIVKDRIKAETYGVSLMKYFGFTRFCL